MPNITIQSRIKPELKEEAEAILDSIGLSMGDAIRLFLQQVVNSGGLPFTPTTKRPKTATRAAMQEFDKGVRHKFTGIQAILDETDEDE